MRINEPRKFLRCTVFRIVKCIRRLYILKQHGIGTRTAKREIDL